jgi:hypothetical protein
VECASVESSADRLQDALRQPLNWPALLAQADEHTILALLAARLQKLAPGAVPPDIETKLYPWQRAQAVFTLSLTAELFQVLQRLTALDIRVLVTKGPALSVRCYGEAGMRQYCDIDLIVRQSDIRRSTEAMFELGYEPYIPLSAIDANKTTGEYVFTRRERRLNFEFHTERTLRYHPQPLLIEEIFQRQSVVTVDGRSVPALSLEDELVLICVHGAKHFWERLMWIADVAALISRQSVDWDRALSLAREVGTERILCLGLRLASDLLGAKLPPQIEATMRSDQTVAKLVAQIESRLALCNPREIGILQRAAFRVQMRSGLLPGLAYLLRLTLSPTEEDWMPGKEGHRLAFLEAISRPLRLAKKHSHRSGK